MQTVVYASINKPTSGNQGNYELTECSAYDHDSPSHTTKPELPPRAQMEDDESGDYAELHVV